MTKANEELIAARILALKAMHKEIIEVGDEDIYDEWIISCVPDEPQEEDYETIARDDGDFLGTLKLFYLLNKKDIKHNY